MIKNYLVFALLVAMTAGGVWLLTRAWRARRFGARVAGTFGAGVLTLLCGAASILGFIGLRWLYGVVPAAVVDTAIAATPERVARGDYLVHIACVGCHGMNQQLPLAGGVDIAEDIPVPIGKLVSANIAPDGILKDRSDGELFRALRHGVGKSGRRLPLMGVLPYRHLSDDDIAAIITYVRQAPPSNLAKTGGDDLNILAAILFGAGAFPKASPPEVKPIAAPARGTTAEYGRYVATFGDCRGCHGPEMLGTAPSLAGPGAPNPRPSVKTWSLDQFIRTMRSGVRPNGQELKMPWRNAAAMDDHDLAALYAYLSQP
jgi:mono/diheme cytochrome c family protein